MNFKEFYQESLEIDSTGVYDDGVKIADIEVDEMPGVTKEEVIGYFVDEGEDENKDPAARYIRSLKLPKKFMYVWIQFIKLLPRQRGQGKGSQILNTLALQYPPGTIMALSAEEVSGGKTASSLEMLKRFYKQNGFTLIRSRGKVFGFRVL
jgi:GNAT superfamily N-acetyltransferase